MPLSPNEYHEIADELFTELRRRGMGDLVAEMAVGARQEGGELGPRGYVLAALDQLVAALQRRNGTMYQRAMELLQAYVAADHPINDIRVLPTLDEAQVLGERDLSLGEVREYGPLIAALRDLRRDLSDA